MGLRLKTTSCIAIGTFNIYIVQPRWLMDEGILAKGEPPVSLETDLDRPGFRFYREGYPFVWMVRPDRIEVESKVRDADCGGELASVLERLRYTPLAGIGCNVELEALDEAGSSVYEYCKRSSATVLGRFQPTKRTVRLSFDGDGRIFNVHFGDDGTELSVAVNIHTELSGSSPIDAAISTCKTFRSLVSEGIELVSALVGQQT